MSVKNLKEKLNNILKKDEPVVVSINGKWGVGKTYFWHQFKEQLTDKKVAYVSLFGKETISSIRTDIFLQVISKQQNNWRRFKGWYFKNIKISYGGIGIGITLPDKQDFKDIIVCFDDFERLSSLMELEEVLGLISELKEQKNCSVVMILNEDELRDNKETLDKYKEKLIDYEFSYDPRPFESLEILQDKLTAFKDYPLQDYLTKHKINNIRVISRIINALNDFSFIESHIKDTPEVTTEIVDSIIQIAAINAQNSSFREFVEYTKKLFTPDEFEENKKYEYLLSLVDGDNKHHKALFLESNVVSSLFKYCQTSLIDEEYFIKIVEVKINNQNLSSTYENINEKHQYDMSYKNKAYVSDLWNLLKEQGYKISIAEYTFLYPGHFIYYIKQLETLDVENKAQYRNFALGCLKDFIRDNLDWMRDDRSGAPQKLLDFDPELDSYYEQCTVENQQESVDSSEKIISLMHNVIKNGKSNELEALSQIQKPKIKQYILSDARYFKETFDFLMRCNVYTPKNM
ncbi:P-loop NTPase fold protein [thiotrophic endosymbiont of Bathymodiolus puteoserpentis (Logatchev)]|uniref:P-loop NTPase fold protein n=1 Tax=thiotrophic endosymbiont of Bathymodiolus puteoserpentis (Logatchev) TaxID=343240 RepID=UPI0010B52690|nr:P-loop NTPase fold protein [thiotrophic endosymbiont of Bathymodiolus puteoserpentis (Logatchev)]SSC10267.1 hypothetical protein BPUTEOSOX_39 [thiotrophic endosymbiont of Bathymodiolus puteoserpentis (Logatchev)]